MKTACKRCTLPIATVLLMTACLVLPEPPAPLPTGSPALLSVGDAREVELHAMRLDVSGYEQVLSKADILALPQKVRRNTWLYNLDLRGHDGSPRLLDNALGQIRGKDPKAPELSIAEANMIGLLNMTPANADLTGTRVEQLLALGPKVGIPSEEVLANALGVDVDAPFLSRDALAKAVVQGVIGSHPNAGTRPGKKTAAHPDGRIPVPIGFLPVTLEDIAFDLKNLPQRFGPYADGGLYHPGFMVGTTEARLLTDDFKMTVRANANALPFKGVDLGNGEVGSVPSIGRDGDGLFDFDDPDWLRIEGIAAKPAVAEMTFQLVEHPQLIEPGDSPLPTPTGNGKVWTLPPWTIERSIAQAGLETFQKRVYSKSFFIGDDPVALFTMTIDHGWLTMTSKGAVGDPPKPLYVWDLMNEVAQVRMHDGGIPEGKADVRFTLRDVAVGVTADQIEQMVRRNLEQDPTSLVDAAAFLLDQHAGAPDVFYYRPRHGSPHAGSDWLYFVNDKDLPEDGPHKIADYVRPGFWSDAALTQPAGGKLAVDGDDAHHKVQIQAGDVLYCADHQAQVFRLDVLAKPSQARVHLRVTRVQ